VWSLAIEVPVVMLLWRPQGSRLRVLGAALAATLLTHPFAITGFRALSPHLSYPARVLVVETAVAAVEAVLFWRVAGMPGPRAVAVSIAANAASYLSGLALRTWT
jgi:hypothetical protein